MKKMIINDGNGFMETNLIIKWLEDKKNRIFNIILLSFAQQKLVC